MRVFIVFIEAEKDHHILLGKVRNNKARINFVIVFLGEKTK